MLSIGWVAPIAPLRADSDEADHETDHETGLFPRDETAGDVGEVGDVEGAATRGADQPGLLSAAHPPGLTMGT